MKALTAGLVALLLASAVAATPVQSRSATELLLHTSAVRCASDCDKLEILLFSVVKNTVEVGEDARFEYLVSSPCFKHWTINFGDGSDLLSGTNKIGATKHAFAKTGKYEVKLTAYDSRGNKKSVARTVRVIGDCPTGCDKHKLKQFKIKDRVVAVGDEVELSFNILSDRFKTWTVDFGDGSSPVSGSTLTKALRHKYNAVGKFEVKLTATNECGEELKKLKKIKVETPGCCVHKIEYLKLADKEIKAGDHAEVSFKIITDGFTKYTIYWGDGTKESDVDMKDTLKHRYNTAGEYKIKLVALNRCGNKVGKTVTIKVHGSCDKSRNCEQSIDKFELVRQDCRPNQATEFAFRIDSPCLDTWWIDWMDGSPRTYGTKLYGRITHQYRWRGTYYATLYIKNSKGEVKSKNVAVRIN